MSTLESLNHSTFAELANKKFRLYHNSDVPVEVELITVGDLVETKRQEIFSIFFSTPENEKTGQGLYKFEHDQLGEIELFLVPIVDSDSTVYEAVFNRLKKKKESQ